MKIKKLLPLLVLPFFALTSCGGDDGPGDGGSGPADKITPESLVDFTAAYEKTKAATSVTCDVRMNIKKADAEFNDFHFRDSHGEGSVPASYVEDVHGVVEKDGNKMRMKSDAEVDVYTIDIAKATEALGKTQNEFVSLFNEAKYEALLDNRTGESYGTKEFSLDLTKGQATVKSTYTDYDEYAAYDETNKQWFEIEPDGEAQWIPSLEMVSLDEQLDVIFSQIKDATLSGNVFTFAIEGITYNMEVGLSKGYVSTIKMTFSQRGRSYDYVMTYSKYNETSVTLPAYQMKKCPHGNHTDNSHYHFEETDTMHCKVCNYCYKFIGQPEPHDFSKNEYHVCEKCFVPEGGKHSINLEGFDREDADKSDLFYLVGSDKCAVEYFKTAHDYDLNFDINSEDNKDATDVCVFGKEKMIFTAKSSNPEKLQGHCLIKYNLELSIYRNIPDSIIEGIEEDEFESIALVEDYLSKNNPTKNYKTVVVSEDHNADNDYAETQLDTCHVLYQKVCKDCGLVDESYLDSTHKNMVSTPVKIDDCHTKVSENCRDCGYHNEYVTTYHASKEATMSKEEIDSCHHFEVYKCPTCGDEVDIELVHEPTKTHTENVKINDCTSAVYTICDDCGLIVDSEENSKHGELHTVLCSYEELDDYGFDTKRGYFEGNLFKFSYCDKCGRVVGTMTSYGYCDFDHPYNPVEIYTYESPYNYPETYGENVVEHSLDDHGICHLCGGKVVDCGNYEFIARYEDDCWRQVLLNKETGENIFYDETDRDDTDEYSLLIYGEGDEEIRVKYFNDDSLGFIVTYKGVNTSITPDMFE